MCIQGKLGKEVTHDLKAKKATNNMDSANAYAVMNILSVLLVFVVVVMLGARARARACARECAKTATC